MEMGRAGTRNLAEKAMEMIPISRITVMTGAILLALSGPVRADYQAGVDAFEARD
jgi:pimeloyl-CoA synthetase